LIGVFATELEAEAQEEEEEETDKEEEEEEDKEDVGFFNFNFLRSIDGEAVEEGVSLSGSSFSCFGEEIGEASGEISFSSPSNTLKEFIVPAVIFCFSPGASPLPRFVTFS